MSWIRCSSASPFDPPRAPPFGGSSQQRDCTTSTREETTAPARFRTEGAVTHGNSNSSGSCDGSDISQETAEAAPRAEQRLLSARRRLDCRRKGDRQEGAHLHGDQGPADHQQVL